MSPRIAPLLTLVLMTVGFLGTEASAQSWSLTKAQRQAYLQYYAPIILKRANGNNGEHGRDWITNFDFDRDGNFSTNKQNGRNLGQYIDASIAGPHSYYGTWRIRPTLYTSLIEFMDGGKALVLIYHVYHGLDGGGIHDWERIELLVRNVVGSPGSGEYVDWVIVTRHHEHIVRRSYDSSLNFMQTATGKHALIWQAEWSNRTFATDKNELHFVKNPYSWVGGQQSSPSAKAEVNINNEDSKKNVHYVFVPEASSAAVSAWNARPLSYTTAASLTSRYDNETTAYWSAVPRITYELQDLADILPTHWAAAAYSPHWLNTHATDILLESPVVNELGQSEVSTGLQRFFTTSKDITESSLTDGRDGYPDKSWFFGTYSIERDADATGSSDDFKTPAYQYGAMDSRGRTRGSASGYYNSHNAFWWQHDYFVHTGDVDSSSSTEAGFWLPGAWYLAANGGFDGRWVQLFDDRVDYEPVAPLQLYVSVPWYDCAYTAYATASASGGVSPYTFTWTSATPYSAPGDSTNYAEVYAYTTAAVTVQSADGQTRSQSFYYEPYCYGGYP
jgi:hypothetical protein